MFEKIGVATLNIIFGVTNYIVLLNTNRKQHDSVTNTKF